MRAPLFARRSGARGIGYADRKGRSLGSFEAVLPVSLRPGESRVLTDIGGWTVAGEVRRVSLKVIEVNLPGLGWR